MPTSQAALVPSNKAKAINHKPKEKMKRKTIVVATVLAFGAIFSQTRQAMAQMPASVVSLMDFRNQLVQLQGDVSATVNSLNAVKQNAKKGPDLEKAATDLGIRFNSLEARVESV